jgi:hypothetical protein
LYTGSYCFQLVYYLTFCVKIVLFFYFHGTPMK